METYDEFVTYFYKSTGIPDDVTAERLSAWYAEVLEYISKPAYEHRHIIDKSKDLKFKVIKIGIVNCWVRSKLLEKGYQLDAVLKIQTELGRKMFFTPSPIWKIAQKGVLKAPTPI